MDGAWILEQPRSSALEWLPVVRGLWRSLPKVILHPNFFFVGVSVGVISCAIDLRQGCPTQEDLNEVGQLNDCYLMNGDHFPLKESLG